MRYLTLDPCKRHLVVEHDADDAEIIQMAESAEETVENYIQCPLEVYQRADGTLPAPIIRGMLLFVGTFYNTREMDAPFDAKTRDAAYALLNPYIRYGYCGG